MYDSMNATSQAIWKELSQLKSAIGQKRKAALKHRIATRPKLTKIEYVLGAFLEMYESHLTQVIYKLYERGYAMEISSGFGGTYGEFQQLNGYFSVDHMTRGRLEKIGVKLREHERCKSLIFWPEKADLNHITQKWIKIVSLLPDRGLLTVPSSSYAAMDFRRKHIPTDPLLKRLRLLEQVRYKAELVMQSDIKKRLEKNPHPQAVESQIGMFIEELEPQVRSAVLTLTRKGYSIDKAGFTEDSSEQMIEGDFQLSDQTKHKLQANSVIIETNPSGYTLIKFTPLKPDAQKIKLQWTKIASIFPAQKNTASASMTRKAREFRLKYK